jgi:uncharacterized protein (DUF1015 family)
MPRISPFAGLRFDRSRVGSLERVTAPPYDVISRIEHERLLDGSPFSVIRLDLGDDPERSHHARYAEAAALFETWRRDGVLIPTDGPVFVAYEMRFRLHGNARRVRGVVAAVELEDWGGGILPHEQVMDGPVQDRLEHLREVRIDLSCIECVYLGPDEAIGAWLDEATRGEPDGSVTDADGVDHRVWVRPGDAALAERLSAHDLMIADGHHRYTTALRYRDEMRARHGAGPWDATMMLLIDAALEEPPVLPFHRIQREGAAADAGGVRVRDLEEVLESLEDRKLLFGIATLEDGAIVHRVAELTGEPPTVCRLHEAVLDVDAEAFRYTPDAVAAEAAVRSGDAVASYFLPATDAATIRSVVASGERLPQKSTFFWPKPRNGLILRPHDTAA